jgi:acetylglutamate kinase
VPAAPHRATDGATVDLGFVGEPVPGADARIVEVLLAGGYVPVVASIGATAGGGLLNVNADTLAAHVAIAAGAERLVIAGATPGVLDGGGRSIPELDRAALAALVDDGTATAGMVAKLRACDRAVGGGVAEVLIVDGRGERAIGDAIGGIAPAGATRIAAVSAARR